MSGALKALKRQYGRTFAQARMVLQSMGHSFAAIVDEWCNENEPKIKPRAWQRDCSLSLPMLLAT